MVTNNQTNYNNSQNQNEEEDYLKISLVNQAPIIRRKRVCPLKDIPIEEINYKNLKLLRKFLTERGKIISRRVTNVSMKKQKALAKAIKRARHVALISPIGTDQGSN